MLSFSHWINQDLQRVCLDSRLGIGGGKIHTPSCLLGSAADSSSLLEPNPSWLRGFGKDDEGIVDSFSGQVGFRRVALAFRFYYMQPRVEG